MKVQLHAFLNSALHGDELFTYRESNPVRPAGSPVTILTELQWFLLLSFLNISNLPLWFCLTICDDTRICEIL